MANFAKLIAEVRENFDSLYTARFLQDLISFFLAFCKIVTKVRGFFSIEHGQFCVSLIPNISEHMLRCLNELYESLLIFNSKSETIFY